MNSSEQKDYEQVTPTENEIEKVIGKIKLLLDKQVTRTEVSEGFLEAIRLLSGKFNRYDQISASLKDDKSRAIAVLSVDYLNGECTEKILLNFR